jgi:hypothetical protein
MQIADLPPASDFDVRGDVALSMDEVQASNPRLVSAFSAKSEKRPCRLPALCVAGYVPRRKREEETSLTTFAAVGLVFCFRFSCRKPLHIAYVVGSTAGERLPIGDYVSWSPISVAALAHELRFSGSGRGVGFGVFLGGFGIGVRFGSARLLSSKAEWKNHANEERDYRFQHAPSLYQQGSGVKRGCRGIAAFSEAREYLASAPPSTCSATLCE